eukprot:tig00021015_g17156.t1
MYEIVATAATLQVRFKSNGSPPVSITNVTANCALAIAGPGNIAWSSTVPVLDRAGSVTVRVTGLAPNTTYSCSAVASNPLGTSEVANSSSFTTFLAHTLDTAVLALGSFAARSRAAGALLQNETGRFKLAVVGGSTDGAGSVTVNTVQIFDLNTTTWQTATATLPANLRNSACTWDEVFSGSVYCSGGHTGGAVSALFWRFPTSFASRTDLPNMPLAMEGHAMTFFNTFVYIAGGSATGYSNGATLLRWSLATGWLTESLSGGSTNLVPSQVSHARLGSKWYFGWASGSPSPSIYELDLGVAPKSWKQIISLSTLQVPKVTQSGLLTVNAPSSSASFAALAASDDASVLGTCGGLLVLVGYGIRPVLIDPLNTTGSVIVATIYNSVMSGYTNPTLGWGFPVRQSAYGSHPFTCLTVAATGDTTTTGLGSYPGSGQPGVLSVFPSGITSRSATLTVRLTFNGGVPVDSVAASCVPAAGGLGDVWSDATTDVDNNVGSATLTATNLAWNTTYTCTANATIGSNTSNPSPAAVFTTLFPHTLELSVKAGGSFPSPCELDMAAASPKPWRLVISLSSMSAPKLVSGNVVFSSIDTSEACGLGACGDYLLWARQYYRPMMIYPSANPAVISEANAVVTGPFLPTLYSTFVSDSFTCSMFVMGGGYPNSYESILVNATYPVPDTPEAPTVQIRDITQTSAVVVVYFRYFGGASVLSVAASCGPTSGGPSAWATSEAVPVKAGSARLIASGLSVNTTYTCTANATASLGTSPDSAAVSFRTAAGDLEMRTMAPGAFAPMWLSTAAMFRNGTSGLKMLLTGGAVSSDTVTINKVYFYDVGTDTWHNASIAQPFVGRSAACAWDENPSGFIYCSGASGGRAAAKSFWRYDVALTYAELLADMPQALYSHSLTVFGGFVWVSGAIPTGGQGTVFRWSEATGWLSETPSGSVVFNFYAPSVRIGTKWYFGWSSTESVGARIWELDLEAPVGQKTWRLVATISGFTGFSSNYGHVLGACGERLVVAFRPYEPVVVEPASGTVLQTGIQASNALPVFPLAVTAYASDELTCTTFAATGDFGFGPVSFSSGRYSSTLLRLKGNYPVDPSAAISRIQILDVGQRVATVVLRFRYNGGQWITSAAAMCTPASGGAAVWAGEVAVPQGSTARLQVTVENIETTRLATGPFAGRWSPAGVLFRNVSSGLQLAVIGGEGATSATQYDSVHVLDVDSNTWYTPNVTIPAGVRSLACAWDHASTIFCTGGRDAAGSSRVQFFSFPVTFTRRTDLLAAPITPTPSDLQGHCMTHFQGRVWITGGVSTFATGKLLRYSETELWVTEAVQSPVTFRVNMPWSRWYAGWGTGTPAGSTNIYEIDLAASGTKSWRLVTTLVGVGNDDGTVLGACGDMLLHVGRGYKPYLIDPMTGSVVSTLATVANYGVMFGLQHSAYDSDQFTCTLVAAAGKNASGAVVASAYRISGSYLVDLAPRVLSVRVESIGQSSAVIRIVFRYNFGYGMASAAASCSDSGTGSLVWSGSAAVAPTAGSADLHASGLASNTTYTCSANATDTLGVTSPDVTANFTTAAASLEMRSLATGFFAGRWFTGGTAFYNGTGGLKLLLAGGSTSGEMAVSDAIFVYDTDTDSWSAAGVTLPVAARNVACAWDEDPHGRIYCGRTASAVLSKFWSYPVSLTSRTDTHPDLPAAINIWGNCITVYDGWVWTNKAATSSGTAQPLYRWSEATGWVTEAAAAGAPPLYLYATCARLGSKWYFGWGNYDMSPVIYEVDLTVSGPRTWRTVATLPGFSVAHDEANIATVKPNNMFKPPVLGTCGDYLLVGVKGLRPLLVEPSAGSVVSNQFVSVNADPVFGKRFGTYASDYYTCTTFVPTMVPWA